MRKKQVIPSSGDWARASAEFLPSDVEPTQVERSQYLSRVCHDDNGISEGKL